MGITEWRVRNVFYTSPHHELCHLQTTLTQSLDSAQKTFLLNLYQAIEKLLKLTPSDALIQKQSHGTVSSDDKLKVKLIFDERISTPTIQSQNPALILILPTIAYCQKSPEAKAVIWKILKNSLS